MKNWYEIGALYRRQFRRLLIEKEIDFKEDKGFLDSFFVINTTLENVLSLNRVLDKYNSI